VSVGSSCLACDSDDLWYRATVVQLPPQTNDNPDGGTDAGDRDASVDAGECRYRVMFDLSHREVVVDASHIFPLHSTSHHGCLVYVSFHLLLSVALRCFINR